MLGCGNREAAKQEEASNANEALQQESAQDQPTNNKTQTEEEPSPPEEPKPSDDQTVTVSLATPKELDAAIKKHKGQVVLVDFWATWCIPCIKNFPHTVEWQKEYGDKGLAVISVSMDDPEEETQEPAKSVLDFLKNQNATFTNFQSKLGGDEDAMKAFDVAGGAIPFYKIYDKTGKLTKTFGVDPCNPFGPEDIEAAIKQALGL